MTFALQNTKLWDYIIGSAKRPSELKETLDDNKDRKKRIYQQWKKIRDFDLDICMTAAKILKMYTDIIQKISSSEDFNQIKSKKTL